MNQHIWQRMIVTAAVLCTLASAAQYTIVDLGTIGGATTTPMSINNSGQVAGSSTLSGDSTIHAFISQLSRARTGAIVMRDLGSFGGVNSQARAVNSPGYVAGGISVGGAVHPILYTGFIIDLGSLGGSQGLARGLNDAGQVVGYSATASTNVSHAFLYSSGKMFDLGTLGGSNSVANAVNNEGAIVGNSELTVGSVTVQHAFLVSGGIMADLGTLGGSNSSAAAINNLNYIVGGAQTAIASSHAFLVKSGTLLDLGTLGGVNSTAFGINDSGLIVGISQIPSIVTGAPIINAFLYSNCQLLNLNTMIAANSGWVLTKALAINNTGQIVGVGQLNGQTRAFLLSPSGSTGTNTDPTTCPSVQLQGVKQ